MHSKEGNDRNNTDLHANKQTRIAVISSGRGCREFYHAYIECMDDA